MVAAGVRAVPNTHSSGASSRLGKSLADDGDADSRAPEVHPGRKHAVQCVGWHD